MTLNGLTWDHPRGYDPLVAASALYEKQFGLKIGWQKRSLTKFGDQSLEELSEKFDLLIIDHPHVGVADATQCIVPLNKLLEKEEYDALEEQSAGPCFLSYQYNENLWALPIDAALQTAVCRPDLMKEWGIPSNWEEVFDLSEKLKQRSLKVGMALCPTDCLCSFLTLTAQFGSPVLEGNKNLVDRETGLKALGMLRRMRDTFHSNCLEWNPIMLYDIMTAQDDIAYSPLGFCYINYSRTGFRKNLLSFKNAPGMRNCLLGGAGIAISSKCKYPLEAARYAYWICNAPVQNSIYVEAQGQPANRIAWESEYANLITGDFFKNTMNSLQHAYVRPRYAGWPAFQTFLGESVHAFLKKDGDPVQLLDRLQEACRDSYQP